MDHNGKVIPKVIVLVGFSLEWSSIFEHVVVLWKGYGYFGLTYSQTIREIKCFPITLDYYHESIKEGAKLQDLSQNIWKTTSYLRCRFMPKDCRLWQTFRLCFWKFEHVQENQQHYWEIIFGKTSRFSVTTNLSNGLNLELKEFNFSMEYKTGTVTINVDALFWNEISPNERNSEDEKQVSFTYI